MLMGGPDWDDVAYLSQRSHHDFVEDVPKKLLPPIRIEHVEWGAFGATRWLSPESSEVIESTPGEQGRSLRDQIPSHFHER